MSPEALREALDGVADLTVRAGEPLGRHNLLRVGGPVDLWLVAETEAAAVAALGLCRGAGVKIRGLVGHHWLARDDGLEGACLCLGAVARGIEPIEGGLKVGAAYPLAALALAAARAGMTGLEALGGQPGTVAEGLAQGLLEGRVQQLRVLRGSRATTLRPDQHKASQIVLSLTLALELSLAHTVQAATAHAAARTQERAGRLMVDLKRQRAADMIRDAGLSGVRLRAVRVGLFEPNCLVNLGGATARDVALVLAMLRDRVKQRTGVELAVHPTHLGRAQAARDSQSRSLR